MPDSELDTLRREVEQLKDLIGGAAQREVLDPGPVCALCGFDWGSHGKNPTVDDCARLLKESFKGSRVHTPREAKAITAGFLEAHQGRKPKPAT